MLARPFWAKSLTLCLIYNVISKRAFSTSHTSERPIKSGIISTLPSTIHYLCLLNFMSSSFSNAHCDQVHTAHASLSTKDKSWSCCQWLYRLYKPHNCPPHLVGLIWSYAGSLAISPESVNSYSLRSAVSVGATILSPLLILSFFPLGWSQVAL